MLESTVQCKKLRLQLGYRLMSDLLLEFLTACMLLCAMWLCYFFWMTYCSTRLSVSEIRLNTSLYSVHVKFGFPNMPFPAFTSPAVWYRVFQSSRHLPHLPVYLWHWPGHFKENLTGGAVALAQAGFWVRGAISEHSEKENCCPRVHK